MIEHGLKRELGQKFMILPSETVHSCAVWSECTGEGKMRQQKQEFHWKTPPISKWKYNNTNRDDILMIMCLKLETPKTSWISGGRRRKFPSPPQTKRITKKKKHFFFNKIMITQLPFPIDPFFPALLFPLPPLSWTLTSSCVEHFIDKLGKMSKLKKLKKTALKYHFYQFSRTEREKNTRVLVRGSTPCYPLGDAHQQVSDAGLSILPAF